MVKGDDKEPVIGAASIIAKSEREKLGKKLDLKLLKEILAKVAYLKNTKYVVIPDHDKLTIKYGGRIFFVKDISSLRLITLLLSYSTFTTYELTSRNGSITLEKHPLSYLHPY